MSNPKCVTHFTGCDCQEAKLAQLTQGLEAVRKQKDEAEMLAQLFEEDYAEWEYKCLQAEKERDEVREHRDELKRGNWEVETSQALEISKLKRERDALSTQIAGLQEQVIARTAERNKLAAERDEARSDLGAKNLLWNSLIAERDRLQADVERLTLNFKQLCDDDDYTIDHLQAQLATAKEALEGILNNVALDWYVKQFRKSEASKGMESGIVAKIHNSGVESRAAGAFERARKALADIQGQGEK